MSRAPSRDRANARAGRTLAASAAPVDGTVSAVAATLATAAPAPAVAGVTVGPRLLGTYITPVGTNEGTPRVITLTNAATSGRDVFAVAVSSAALTVAAPWSSLAVGSGGTVYGSWRLTGANNAGITSITVTQGATQYPFAMLVFEDTVTTIQSSLNAISSTPSGGTWNNRSLTLTSSWRNVYIWAGVKFQSTLDRDISAYSNGLTELGDTDSSSIFNNAHASWYSCRIWVAHATGLSGSVTPAATLSGTEQTSAGWATCIAYT